MAAPCRGELLHDFLESGFAGCGQIYPGEVKVAKGVLDDGPATALRARVVDRRPDRTLLEIVMGEGRKREVRRMCEAVGHPVERLVRTAIGPLRDSRLRSGESRHLTIDEVRSLYAATVRSGEPT